MENVISEQQLQSLKIFITQSCTEEAQSYTELVFFKPLDGIVFEGVFYGKLMMENVKWKMDRRRKNTGTRILLILSGNAD